MATFTEEVLDRMVRDIGEGLGQSARGGLGGPAPGLWAARRVFEAPSMVEEYTYTRTFPGHPLVQWLSRWFDFDPDIHVTYTATRPRREALLINGCVFGHPVFLREVRALMVDTSVS